jgi:hypothetical protein
VTTPLRIAFRPAVCTSLSEGSDREWLVADGCGRYAMGTVCGLRTRRYHGLLVPAVGGPAARRLGLVALDPLLELPSGASMLPWALLRCLIDGAVESFCWCGSDCLGELIEGRRDT